ncbi:MAG: tRNA 2-thiocytidine biosynthesis TtcA family protein [Firmicutes bacterium]|nr:tRNA 2-thiocytidine biosynthesis TtcA family protein [Bacillota bacterium]
MADGHLKWVKSKVKKAILHYGMLQDGDRVAVGLSGGKDSMALLHLLHLIRREIPVDYMLHGIYINPGWPAEIEVMDNFCRDRGIPFLNKITNIGEVVFECHKGNNPCSLCANLRRGAINNTARDLGLNKLALGHHLDDVVETFLMSLLFTGQFKTFSPVTYMDRSGITLIRPLIYLTEKTIATFVQRQMIPLVKSRCPANGQTKREEMKELLLLLEERYPDLRAKFLTALQTQDLKNMWPPVACRNMRALHTRQTVDNPGPKEE